MSILGIEIGVTHCMAAVFSLDGRVLGKGRREYPLEMPAPGARELDAELVMERVRDAIIEAVETASGKDPVQALAVASQGEAIVPVDREGRALGPALTTFDSRPASYAQRLAEEVGVERIQHLTGLPIHPMYSLPKLLWWKDRHPALMAKAWKCVTFGDLLLMRLGFDPVTDYSMAGRTMAMDLHARVWSRELLDAAGISSDLLPRLAPAGMTMGTLRPATAARYHLPSGVQAVVGGHDQACVALASGALSPDVAVDALGAVESLIPVLAEPVVNAAMREGRYGCWPHVVPNRFLTLAYNFSGGSLLHWFRDTLGHVEEEEARVSGLHFFDILVGKATPGPSGVLVLPYFTVSGTPHLDSRARGAMVGLTLATSKGEIIKGLLDGLVYEMRLNLERLADAGVMVDTLRAIGAPAASDTWLQLCADIMNRPVEGMTHQPCPACWGAAMLAGTGAGLYNSLEEAAQRGASIRHRAEPHPEAVVQYAPYYEQYTKLYPALKPILHSMPES